MYNYLIRQQTVEHDHQVTKFRAGGWERDAVLLRKQGIKLIGESLEDADDFEATQLGIGIAKFLARSTLKTAMVVRKLLYKMHKKQFWYFDVPFA